MSAIITALKGSSEPVITLRQRIADALTTDTNSAEIRSCIAHTLAELARVEREHGRATAKAVDPLSSEEEAEEARRTLEALRFDKDRLQASEKRLAARLEAVEHAEGETSRREAYDAAVGARQAMLDEVTEKYPKLAGEMIDLLHRMLGVERQIHRANQTKPDGADHIGLIEFALRPSGVGAYGSVLPLYQGVQLPKLIRRGGDDYLKVAGNSWSLPL